MTDPKMLEPITSSWTGFRSAHVDFPAHTVDQTNRWLKDREVEKKRGMEWERRVGVVTYLLDWGLFFAGKSHWLFTSEGQGKL